MFERAPSSRFDLETVFDHSWLLTCRVKILVVTDSSSGGFGDTDGFHLGQILRILDTDPWPHVRFEVTKAHRQTAQLGPGNVDLTQADHYNFRFNNHNLSQYSQIWLFGIERTSGALSNPELKALAQFMDNGGGVFATGDHQNLGQAMCAEVPRVRSMRRWYHPNPGPNGEPVAPDQTGADRHDTVVDTDPATPGLQGNQSDKVPQTVRPRYYSRYLAGPIYRAARFPHPVLCGPDGVITNLPDHMHEGLCEVPPDLTDSFTFDGYTTDEYPSVSGFRRPPEVIAWADSHGTNASDFGVLAAYDGHRVEVGGKKRGRVLVDATWHHWFNINLTGFLNATDPAHPTYDASVVPKWEAIKAYYRNVAAWLAGPTLQGCLKNGSWLVATRFFDILITRQPIEVLRDQFSYYWQLGTFARDALGRLASQCQHTGWILEILELFELPVLVDPWEIRPRPLPDPPPWIDLENLELVALGGIADALGEKFGKERDLQPLVEERPKEVDEVARQGAARGIKCYLEQQRENLRALDGVAETVANVDK